MNSAIDASNRDSRLAIWLGITLLSPLAVLSACGGDSTAAQTSGSTSSSSSATSSSSSSSSSSATTAKSCTYASSATVAAGSRAVAVAAADFNQDGRLDLVITNQGDGTLTVALGSGDGKFGTPATYAVSTVGPYETAIADFNKDGYPDLVSANFGASSGTPYGTSVSVLMNEGTRSPGVFQSYQDYATTTDSSDKMRAVATGDFNGDGYPDIAVAEQSGGVSVLLNQSGTFSTYTHYAAVSIAHGIVVADFNLDGKLDIAVANNDSTGSVAILFGNGDGTFQSAVSYAAGAGTFAIAAGDFNGDGYPDLVTANSTANTISVLINNGNSSPGTFATHVDYATSENPVAVSVGDLNGDGVADVLASANSGGATDIFYGAGDGTFGSLVALSTGSGSYHSVIGDFNGDGTADIASVSTTGVATVYLGTCQ